MERLRSSLDVWQICEYGCDKGSQKTTHWRRFSVAIVYFEQVFLTRLFLGIVLKLNILF